MLEMWGMRTVRAARDDETDAIRGKMDISGGNDTKKKDVPLRHQLRQRMLKHELNERKVAQPQL